MGLFNKIYNSSIFSLLFTDYYHLTTSQIYFHQSRQKEKAIFYSYLRNNYKEGFYNIFSGIDLILEFLNLLKKNLISDDEVLYLKSLKNIQGERIFQDDFLNYLQSLKFDIDIFSLKEKDLFFSYMPILRLEGNLVEVKILEPIILNILNTHCAYATHGSRIRYSCDFDFKNGSPKGLVSVQGMRRGMSLGASLESSYSLMNQGYDSTSTVL